MSGGTVSESGDWHLKNSDNFIALAFEHKNLLFSRTLRENSTNLCNSALFLPCY